MERPFTAYDGTDPYVFVSYAHADSERVYPLLTALKASGHHIWYDEGIEPGSSWRSELAEAIAGASQVLFVASARSVTSRNCQREIEYALSQGVEVRVCYIQEAELPPALAFELGGQQAVVATHYDPQTFNEKVSRLLSGEHRPTRSPATSPARGRPNRPALLAAVAAIAALAAAVFLWRAPSPPPVVEQANLRPTAENPATVAVRPIRNASGNGELDWIGEGLAELLRDNLSSSRYAVVLSQPSWDNIVRGADDDPAIFSAALDSGIDFLVSGYLLPDEDQLLLNVRVTNLRAGLDVVSQSFGGLTPRTLVNSAQQIAIIAKQGMKIPREDRLQSLSADFPVDNLAAYEAYISGVRSYNSFRYDLAENAFKAALEIDPGFHPARLRLANVLWSGNQNDQALRALGGIPADSGLGSREQGYVDGLRAMIEGKPEQAVAAYEALLDHWPYDVDGQLSLAQALYQSYRESEAITTLKALAAQEPRNHHVWATMSFIAMTMNDLVQAREALKQYVSIAPEVANAWELFGALELKSNNLEKAIAHYEEALRLDPEFEVAKLGLARVQLLAGDYQSAELALEALRDDPTVSSRSRVGAAFDLVAMARAQRRPQQVIGRFEPVLDALREGERSRLAWHWAQKAYAAIEQDDTAEAAGFVTQAIAALGPQPAIPTRLLFLRARYQLSIADAPGFAQTLDTILAQQLPADNPDRTEERAVAYLKGLDALARQDEAAALDNMQRANNLEGFQYELYRFGLARAQALNGRIEEATRSSDLAATERINYLSQQPRTDLELYRREARELQHDLLQKQGRTAKAADLQAQIRARWGLER